MMNLFKNLEAKLKGPLYFDTSALHQTQLLAYSTDASVYQEKPAAVCCPADILDIIELVKFAHENKVTIIPRAAGTSLAGQVVGNGLVVDISMYFNRIFEINIEEKWVSVEPGVIRDDLNKALQPYGLMFGPETSTANRAMIGGMIGNNSCGLHSIVWGNVRDHLQEVEVVLSDGSIVTVSDNGYSGSSEFAAQIYQDLFSLLENSDNQKLIAEGFPKASVMRRNTGYALDALMGMQPFSPAGSPFNLCALIAGSEGTLAFVTKARLRLMDLPAANIALLCIHSSSVDEALKANLVAIRHQPTASELVDKYICDFTIGHPEYGKNRFFIEGDPAAILMVEFMDPLLANAVDKARSLANELKAAGLGYAFPVLTNEETKAAWEIRKAGLGLLRNLKGDAQPVNLIEDCAVAPADLPDYIHDLENLLKNFGVKASYYAHAGAGELHVEPLLDLKSAGGRRKFREILAATVKLVKNYGGSLSGEHGDGRLRGEFIPEVMGAGTYQLFEKVKRIFDPNGIFNAQKITNTPRMDSNLRYSTDAGKQNLPTVFDFSETGGMLAMTEKCSGSGDCRKSAITGGVMCPSYMATRQEKDTTRARANVLRQFLSNPLDKAPLNHPEIEEVLDLCISCKGCKTECPSGVDVSKLKAEFLQSQYDVNGAPARAKLIANYKRQMNLASIAPGIFNAVFGNTFFRPLINRAVGFHPDRTMPLLHSQTLRKWLNKREELPVTDKKVYLFIDEFTNYNDTAIGKKAVLLLEKLGYTVLIPEHLESGRTYLSKGFLRKAKEIANSNIEMLCAKISAGIPLIGIEPSAILTFRDEYIALADNKNKEKAAMLARICFTIEEFLANEAKAGRIDREKFTQDEKLVHIHGHCYQKALSSQTYLEAALSLPVNYKTRLIPSGCCGMAGSFGYEKEHYEVSMQIGELVLFPQVRNREVGSIVAASGTSCRHQIKDGTNVLALHPVEILYDALKTNVS